MSNPEEPTVQLPVTAEKMAFGSYIWFIVDANNKNIAQIMPSTDEAKCRELVRLINLGAAADKESSKPEVLHCDCSSEMTDLSFECSECCNPVAVCAVCRKNITACGCGNCVVGEPFS